MRGCLGCYLWVNVLAGCQVVQSQGKRAEATRTFAELSLQEKYTYLRAVLKAQEQAIRATRIARVKSHREQLTHRVDLQAVMIDNGVDRPQLIRLSWSPVQADSIELLRCQAKDIAADKTVAPDTTVVAAGYDFDHLLSKPNDYGFLSCRRVYGEIKNGTSIVDYLAENEFSYNYFLRPCFKNYVLTAPATDASKDEECGEEKIVAAENQQNDTDTAEQTKLVFRYCPTAARQVCSKIVSKANGDNSPPLSFNRGMPRLPTHLSAELKRLTEKIDHHENKVWELSGGVLGKILNNPISQDTAKHGGMQAELSGLYEEHKDDMVTRMDRAEEMRGNIEMLADNMQASVNSSIDDYVRIANQQQLPESLGLELSFGKNNCYGDYKEVKEQFSVERQIEQGRAARRSTYTAVVDSEETRQQEEQLREGAEELKGYEDAVVGLAVGGCLVSSLAEVGKLVNLNPLKKGFLSQKMPEGFSSPDWNLAAVNVVTSLIPMENSQLNKPDSITAFVDALHGIFAGADTYVKNHCKACLDYIAELRYHTRQIRYLQERLATLNVEIDEELRKKGAIDDPHAP